MESIGGSINLSTDYLTSSTQIKDENSGIPDVELAKGDWSNFAYDREMVRDINTNMRGSQSNKIAFSIKCESTKWLTQSYA